MTQSEVDQYVKNELALNKSSAEITIDLQKKGIDKNTIDAALNQRIIASVGFKKKSSTGSVLLLVALIILGFVCLSTTDNGLNHTFGYKFIIIVGIIGLVTRLLAKR